LAKVVAQSPESISLEGEKSCHSDVPTEVRMRKFSALAAFGLVSGQCEDHRWHRTATALKLNTAVLSHADIPEKWTGFCPNGQSDLLG
jgi:hypothetical protein